MRIFAIQVVCEYHVGHIPIKKPQYSRGTHLKIRYVYKGNHSIRPTWLISPPDTATRQIMLRCNDLTGANMEIVIDLGKRKSYVVMEDNGVLVKEGYTKTTMEGFSTFFGHVDNPKIIVEASSTVNRIANIFKGYDLTVAHPAKVKLIAQSVKKTDKIDAHTIMDLYKKDYLPKSYLPAKEVRDCRDICRERAFLVGQRTAVKNKIRHQTYCLGIEFKTFTKKNIGMLKENSKLKFLIEQLESTTKIINEYEKMINVRAETNAYVKLIDTIPGIGKISALGIMSEIGNIDRFPAENNIFAYAGLVPRIYQSGSKEWKGRITHGNTFLKWMLVECVGIHIINAYNSPITAAYENIRERSGNKKAKIAAARHILRAIYYMLRRNQDFDSYLRDRRMR